MRNILISVAVLLLVACMGSDGKPAPPGLIPTLEESLANRTWIVGSPEQVAEWRRAIGLPEVKGDLQLTVDVDPYSFL